MLKDNRLNAYGLFFQRRQLGITLLEVMLVLAIIAAVVVIGMRLYIAFSLQNQVNIIRQNVDDLMIAMANYYQSKCGPVYGATTVTTVDLRLSRYQAGTYVIQSAQLKSEGFLPATWPRPTTLVTRYMSQFVQFAGTDPGFTKLIPPDPSCTGANCTPISIQKQNLPWNKYISVAAVMVDDQTATEYEGVLGADCISSGGGHINPCASAVPRNLLVWESLPDQVFTKTGNYSSLTPSMMTLKQYYRFFTSDEFYALQADVPAYDTGPSTAPPTGYQSYFCNG